MDGLGELQAVSFVECPRGGRYPSRRRVVPNDATAAGEVLGSGGALAGTNLDWGHRIRQWSRPWLCERQLVLRSARSVRRLALPVWLQAAALGTGLILSGGIAFLAFGYFQTSHALVRQEAAADSAAVSNADASAMLAGLRRQLAELRAENASLNTSLASAETQKEALEAARAEFGARAHEVEQQLNAKADTAVQLAKTLERTRKELHNAEAQRNSLQNNVHDLQAEVQHATARAKEYKAALESRRRQGEQLAAAPKEASGVSVDPTPKASANAAPNAAAGPGGVADAGKAAAPSRAHGAGSEIERLIASTGLDIERLLGKLDSPPAGQGGPYVALGHAGKGALSTGESQRADELQKLMRTLPLAAPLDHYQLESAFGSRSDPFRHRPAFHNGLDLSAPYKTPVFSTGPGVVVFAGARDEFGKMVEIDHGHGIVTRYAHLHRVVVARGQKVRTHQEIGQLGSTGRSTGPHVHYEVLIDGVPQDPEKFLDAGRSVVQVSGK